MRRCVRMTLLAHEEPVAVRERMASAMQGVTVSRSAGCLQSARREDGGGGRRLCLKMSWKVLGGKVQGRVVAATLTRCAGTFYRLTGAK